MAAHPPSQPSPSRPWRFTSALTIGIVGLLCRGFLFGLNKTEVIGLDRFLEILDKRKDINGRERGLITVSNHLCVLDDPIIWGVLPLKYAFNPDNHRFGLGSYDICFKNKATSLFFTLGQVLPTHRSAHSQYGGLFQPTVTQAIRLLSSQPFTTTPSSSSTTSSSTATDPFTTPHLTYPSYPATYSTNTQDSFPAPSASPTRKHSWIHIFPEGRIHQHPSVSMRYFKWGISRLILESDTLPAIVPMFIDGTQEVMHEARRWPRFVPRAGKKITVAFGEEVDGEKVFGELRRRWRGLVERDIRDRKKMVKEGGENSHSDREGKDESESELEMGILTETLKYSPEAVELRMEVTRRVRGEVLKLRRSLGYEDEDPKAGLMETWREEGGHGRREGEMDDGSWVKDA